MKKVSRNLSLRTAARSQMVDVTGDLGRILSEESVREGRMTITVPHTTAGVTINEHADPSVAADLLDQLDRMIPWNRSWRHGEGNSAAHIKASLVGSSVTVYINEGSLQLGTWQAVFFCEFDGPRSRSMWVRCEIY